MPKGKKTDKVKSASKLTSKQKAYDQQVKQLEQKLKRKAKSINKRGYVNQDIFPEKPEKRLQSYIKKLQERIENIYEYSQYVNPRTGEVISGEQGRRLERSKAAQKAAQTRHDRKWLEETERFNRKYEEFREKYRDQIESDKPFDFKVSDIFSEREPTKEERDTLPSEAVIIVERVYDEIARWQPDPRWSNQLSEIKREDKDQLRSIIDGAMIQLGRDQVIRNLADNAEEFEAICMEIMYVSGDNMRQTGREGIRINLAKIAQMVWGRALSVEESQILQRQAEMYSEYE